MNIALMRKLSFLLVLLGTGVFFGHSWAAAPDAPAALHSVSSSDDADDDDDKSDWQDHKHVFRHGRMQWGIWQAAKAIFSRTLKTASRGRIIKRSPGIGAPHQVECVKSFAKWARP